MPDEETAAPDEAPPVLDASENRHLLSREVLEKVNADLFLEAKQVVSGKDELGSGSMRLLLQDGRLALEPLQINAPGGGVNAAMSMLHRDGNIDFSVTANVDHFDYGVLARRVDAETDMRGIMSLDVVVTGD